MNKVTVSAVARRNVCPNVQPNNILLHIKWKAAGCYRDQHCWDESWAREAHALHRQRFFLLFSVSLLPSTHMLYSWFHKCLGSGQLTDYQLVNKLMQSVIMSTTVLAAPTYQTCTNILVSTTRCPVFLFSSLSHELILIPAAISWHTQPTLEHKIIILVFSFHTA
jgi:hypothetical protein